MGSRSLEMKTVKRYMKAPGPIRSRRNPSATRVALKGIIRA